MKNGSGKHDLEQSRDEIGLEWLQNDPDPQKMAELAQVEIADALESSSTPRHWKPVEVDEALLR